MAEKTVLGLKKIRAKAFLRKEGSLMVCGSPRLGRGLRHQCRWFFRHDNPGDHISQEPCSAANGQYQPHDSDKSDVEIEILGKTQAHTGNFASIPRPQQSFARNNAPNPCSTVTAEVCIVLNHFATVIAVHKNLLESRLGLLSVT